MTEQNEKRRWYKLALASIGAIFVGAIGSGLWEFFLRDALNFCFSGLASGLGMLSSTYLDNLHEDIGKANVNNLVFLPFLFLVVGVISFSIFGLLFFFRMRRKSGRAPSNEFFGENGPLEFMLGKGFWLFVAMGVFNILSYSEMLFSAAYSARAVTWVDRSIEIVRPHIALHEYIELRARYRAVEDAKSFYGLYQSLKAVEAKNSLTLPEFKPVGFIGVGQTKPITKA